MRLPVFFILAAVFLSGCASSFPDKTSEVALTKPTSSEHEAVKQQHDYQIYGSMQSGEFLVDTASGAVWQYESRGNKSLFEKITVAGLNSGETIAYKDNGVIYDIPVAKISAFLKAHPYAIFTP